MARKARKPDKPAEAAPRPSLKTQYAAIKARYPDVLILMRVGDFYETFEDDAKIAARVLGLPLDRGGTACAFPFFTAEERIAALVKAGHKVAVREPIVSPIAEAGKGVRPGR